MASLQIGLSAIQAAQTALNNALQNIANATTPGYHRQRVDQVSRASYRVGRGPLLGGGVDVATIARLRAPAVESSLTANVSGRAAATTLLDALQQVERALQPGDGSIHGLASKFFDSAEQLSASPADSALRQQMISAASELVRSASQISRTLSGIGPQLTAEIETEIQTINQTARRIADLNRDIRVALAHGRSANSLLDQRDLAINELAQHVDIDSRSLLEGGDPLVAAGGALLIGESTSTIRAERLADGRVMLASSTGQRNISVFSGRLSGLLEASATIQSGIAADFDQWTTELVQRVDQIHATGIGLSGPASRMTGSRQLSDVDLPLADARSPFQLNSGSLAITVTDAAGNRRTTKIAIDIAADSLRDVAARLDAVAGIGAFLSDSGNLNLVADPGSTIDFAGRVDQQPNSLTITGTARPTLSGIPSMGGNDELIAEVVSGGTVGVSQGLIVRVSSAVTGQLIGDFDFGQGYAAGQPVVLSNGVSISMTPGSLATGDQFTFSANGQPDETGLLAALGVQTLFSGSSPAEFQLSSEVQDSFRNLALSRNGSVTDGQQLDRFETLRLQRLFSAESETIEQRLASLTSFTGVLVETKQQELGQRDETQLQLETARDAVSGVDPNEELLEMLQYQRAFQAASRFVTSVNESLDDLMNLIG